MSKEIKAEKANTRVLDDANRARIVDQLSDLGVIDPSTLSDCDLIAKLSDILSETHEKNIRLAAQSAIKPLNIYAAKAHKDLKDKDFIERLFNLSIPDIFLCAFTDDDAKKDDKKLWEIVKFSGVSQYEHHGESFRNKIVYRPIYREIPREYRVR